VTELRIGDQLIRFDREATIAAYSAVTQGWADRCTCSGCRNFARQRDRVYPIEFRNLLNTLGIDPAKEGEAVHHGPASGFQFYGGWFYFVGELLEKGESIVSIRRVPTTVDPRRERSSVPEEFQYFIGTAFPRPPAAFGKSVAAVEFSTLLPWVLEEPYDPAADAVIQKLEEVMRRYPNALRALAKPED
jgi:hypothetical protein